MTFSNNGGWPTTGLSCMVGLTAPVTILIGNDCSAHMCKSSDILRCQARFSLIPQRLMRNATQPKKLKTQASTSPNPSSGLSP